MQVLYALVVVIVNFSMAYSSLILMTIIGAFAGYCLKKASNDKNWRTVLLQPWLYGGGALYLIAAWINVIVLKYLQYSVVLPLTSITYVWTLIISHYFLHEHIGREKIIGVVLIMLGAVLVNIGQ